MSDTQRHTGELQVHEVEIARAAERCYGLFVDFERLPEWVPEVRSARIHAYDDDGEPEVVDFMATAERGGLVYRLHYRYRPEKYHVSWESVGPTVALRDLRGEARFVPVDAACCRMHYQVVARLGRGLPGWMENAYGEQPAEATCRAFKRWVEGMI